MRHAVVLDLRVACMLTLAFCTVLQFCCSACSVYMLTLTFALCTDLQLRCSACSVYIHACSLMSLFYVRVASKLTLAPRMVNYAVELVLCVASMLTLVLLCTDVQLCCSACSVYAHACFRFMH